MKFSLVFNIPDILRSILVTFYLLI